MSISVKEAQRLGLIPKPEKPTRTSAVYVHPLTKRLLPICSRYGWQVDVYRAFCTLPESPRSTSGGEAKPNAVIVWRETYRVRVEHLGWIWDVETMSDDEVEIRLRELEVSL